MKKQNIETAVEGDESAKNKEAYLFLTNVTVNSRKLEKSFVVPGHIHVKNNDTVTIKAVNTGALYIFPNGELLFQDTGRDYRNIRVKKDGELTLTISENAPKGNYPFAVITDNNDFAAGGSYPEFVVE